MLHNAISLIFAIFRVKVQLACMVTAATKISLKLNEQLSISAYQLTEVTSEAQSCLLFTHRQISEVIGRTKSTVQRFIKKHSEEFPPAVSAKIPERPRPVPLTSSQAALAYWKQQAQQGNEIAQILIESLANQSLNELEPMAVDTEISTVSDTVSAPSPASTPPLKIISEGIELASKWMEEGGVDKAAIAQWKLNELARIMPQLSGITTSAVQLIAQQTSSPTGMIPSQLAEQLSEQLEKKVTATAVNQALHQLGLQDWLKPGKTRERKLTEAGKQYGMAVLTTSRDGWQGAQLRWFESVVPVLKEYLIGQ